MENLSGDEVDPRDIIEGGRAARKGRAQFASARGQNKYVKAQQNKKKDEDDDDVRKKAAHI